MGQKNILRNNNSKFQKILKIPHLIYELPHEFTKVLGYKINM